VASGRCSDSFRIEFKLAQCVFAAAMAALSITAFGPPLKDAVLESRLRSEAYAAFALLTAARASAVTQNARIAVCRSNAVESGTLHCAQPSGSAENGLLAYLIHGPARDFEPQRDVEISSLTIRRDNVIMRMPATLARLVFRPDGTVDIPSTVTLSLEDERGPAHARHIRLSPRGHITLSRGT
jgi:Tfp pilus assembly protein FimT